MELEDLKEANYLLTLLVPVVFVFLWSTGFMFSKMGLPYAEPLGFLSIRFSIAAIVLLIVQLLLSNSQRKSISLVKVFHYQAADKRKGMCCTLKGINTLKGVKAQRLKMFSIGPRRY